MKKPQWYKVVIDHGPGHQSRTVRYLYSTPIEISEKIEASHMAWPIFTIRKTKKLPVDVKKQFIERAKSIISYEQKMLKILQRM